MTVLADEVVQIIIYTPCKYSNICSSTSHASPTDLMSCAHSAPQNVGLDVQLNDQFGETFEYLKKFTAIKLSSCHEAPYQQFKKFIWIVLMCSMPYQELEDIISSFFQ